MKIKIFSKILGLWKEVGNFKILSKKKMEIDFYIHKDFHSYENEVEARIYSELSSLIWRSHDWQHGENRNEVKFKKVGKFYVEEHNKCSLRNLLLIARLKDEN